MDPVQWPRQRRRAAGQHHPGCLHRVLVESNPPDFDGCLTSQGIREAVIYQPASRYWPFQWTETALYLAAALALAAASFHRLRRRLT